MNSRHNEELEESKNSSSHIENQINEARTNAQILRQVHPQQNLSTSQGTLKINFTFQICLKSKTCLKC